MRGREEVLGKGLTGQRAAEDLWEVATYQRVQNIPVCNTGADWANFSSGYEPLSFPYLLPDTHTYTLRTLGEVAEVLCALPIP